MDRPSSSERTSYGRLAPSVLRVFSGLTPDEGLVFLHIFLQRNHVFTGDSISLAAKTSVNSRILKSNIIPSLAEKNLLAKLDSSSFTLFPHTLTGGICLRRDSVPYLLSSGANSTAILTYVAMLCEMQESGDSFLGSIIDLADLLGRSDDTMTKALKILSATGFICISEGRRHARVGGRSRAITILKDLRITPERVTEPSNVVRPKSASITPDPSPPNRHVVDHPLVNDSEKCAKDAAISPGHSKQSRLSTESENYTPLRLTIDSENNTASLRQEPSTILRRPDSDSEKHASSTTTREIDGDGERDALDAPIPPSDAVQQVLPTHSGHQKYLSVIRRFTSLTDTLSIRIADAFARKYPAENDDIESFERSLRKYRIEDCWDFFCVLSDDQRGRNGIISVDDTQFCQVMDESLSQFSGIYSRHKEYLREYETIYRTAGLRLSGVMALNRSWEQERMISDGRPDPSKIRAYAKEFTNKNIRNRVLFIYGIAVDEERRKSLFHHVSKLASVSV